MGDERWVKAAKTSDIADGGGVVFDPEGRKIALFRSAGNFYAVDNTCPHRGGPLAEGFVENLEVTCPWHAWTFDVKTGACTSAPGIQIKSYRTKIENGEVFVEI